MMNDAEEHSLADDNSPGAAPHDSLGHIGETADGCNNNMSLSPNYTEGAGIRYWWIFLRNRGP